MRVTIDTNVYVSALNFGGAPGQILDLNTDDALEICLSPAIIEELRGVLRDRFDWPAAALEAVLEPIISRAVIVVPTRVVTASRDPDDNHILACALEANAGVIVTGDNDLLLIGSFEGIEIVNPRQFLDRYGTRR